MNLTSAEFLSKETYTFEDLLAIVRLLRSPNGCPWDRAQTHASVRKNLLEETYEVAEGIDRDDAAILREELGDHIFQAVFHTVIEEERGRFTADDVITAICRKMIFRHPHIFAGEHTNGKEEALDAWESAKRQEKHQKTAAESMHALPKTLPALMYAAKMSGKAARVGFTYESAEEAAEKVCEEWGELAAAHTKEERKEEYGDLLFALVNYGRMLGIDAEEALALACEKFLSRFEKTEAALGQEKGNLAQCTKKEWISAWNTAKL